MTKRKYIRYLQSSMICLAVLGLWIGFAYARMKPAEPGTIRTYQSDNKRYEVEIAFGDRGMNLWRLMEKGKVLWDNALSEDYASITISDNGETIAVTTWGWQDEGGVNGMMFYNKKGQLVRTVLFPEGSLKWIAAMAISPDGKYFVLGESARDKARVTLYDVKTGEIVWEKSGGDVDVAEIKVSLDAKHVLVATHNDSGQGMVFLLFDKKGRILWEKKTDGYYSWDVKRYLGFKDNGQEFEIFDPKTEVFIPERYP